MRCVDHLFEDLERLLEKRPVERLEQLETQLNQLERSIKMSQDALTNQVAGKHFLIYIHPPISEENL